MVRPATTVTGEREIAVAVASRFCQEKFEARHALDSPVTSTSGSPKPLYEVARRGLDLRGEGNF